MSLAFGMYEAPIWTTGVCEMLMLEAWWSKLHRPEILPETPPPTSGLYHIPPVVYRVEYLGLTKV